MESEKKSKKPSNEKRAAASRDQEETALCLLEKGGRKKTKAYRHTQRACVRKEREEYESSDRGTAENDL